MSSFDDLTHNLTPALIDQSLTAVNIQRLIQLLSTTVALGMLLLSTGLPASGQVQVLDQVVAIVDDDIILASELQERLQGVRSTMEARGVEVPEDEILVRETLDGFSTVFSYSSLTATACNPGSAARRIHDASGQAKWAHARAVQTRVGAIRAKRSRSRVSG